MNIRNKRKIRILLLASMTLILGSCEKLDYAPADQLSESTFWQTEEHARQGAVGMYNALRQPWCFGMEFTFDMCSDIADGTSPWADVSRGTAFTSASSGVQNHWQYLYELVHRCNSVIRNVAGMDIDPETIRRVTGEARFLRALAYFRMLNCWGGVPYYDETCDINKEFSSLDSPRCSEEELRGHILSDLSAAIELLPVEWSSEDYGRATKGAARALRGKVYLFNREYEEAINDFEEIVYNRGENYGYSLHPDYDGLFRLYNGQKSREMIFSIQSIDGNTAGYALDIVSYFGNKSTLRLIASNRIVPSTTIVDMFENSDGSSFSWDDVFPGFESGDSQFRRDVLSVAINNESTMIVDSLNCDVEKIRGAYEHRDPRLCLNVITPYSHYLGSDAGSNPMDKEFVLADPSKGGAPMEAAAFIRNSEGWNSYFWRKWIPTGNLDGYWGEYTRTPYEFPLIRLGDVILMLAEAYNETGQPDRAVAEINKIRARVGMPLLGSGPSWLAVSGEEEVRERIFRERAFELMGEGQRYWDLKRWGRLEETVRDARDIFGDLMYSRAYQARHEKWPIPLVEMERNPNLVQNPGW